MKKVTEQIIIPIVCLLFLLFIIINLETIANKGMKLIDNNPDVILQPINTYIKKDVFQFIQNTTNFIPYSKQDLKNIFYTIVNNGWNNFTFYCPKEYLNCLDDMTEFSKDRDLLTHINNFVHPFNGFSNVETIISETGDITITVDYFYSDEHKELIKAKTQEVYQEIITNEMNTETKILVIHDYIINNSRYDIERNNGGTSSYHSYSAYGPLIEGIATCNGYTDAMAIFLTMMNIPNFKVATTPLDEDMEGHVWNAVYSNDKWLHLDLTWDDPVSNDGNDYLQHKYFLVTTNQLKEADKGEVIVTEHEFKTNIYIELKEEAYE